MRPVQPTERGEGVGGGERLARLVPHELDAAQRELRSAITGGPRGSGPQAFSLTHDDGALVGPFGLMLHAPHVGSPLERLGTAVRYETSFTAREREIAILTVAARLDSGFEWWAHERIARAAGLSDEDLGALASGDFVRRPDADPSEVAVQQAAHLLAHREPWDDERYAGLVEVLGQQRLLELVVLVGYYGTLALMLEVFDVGAPPA